MVMHTSATRICSPDPEHISHIAARYKRSEPSRRPVLSYPAGSCCRALPIHCPHHPISELPRSKHIPPSSLPAHRSILAHDSYTSRAHIRRDGGLRLAPASLPSHSTMLLHTLHKISVASVMVLLTEHLSSVCFQQTDGRHYTLHLRQFKPAALRSCIHSAQLPRQPAEAGQEKETAANTS